jgi:hypothetical protein
MKVSVHVWSELPHERHASRRWALSVPQRVQRLYIVRANQLVKSALAIKMTARTPMLMSVSFNSRRPR